jgi:hypothetical protein
LRTSRRGAGVGDEGVGLAIGRGSSRSLRLFLLRHVEALSGRTIKGQRGVALDLQTDGSAAGVREEGKRRWSQV